MSHIVIPVRFVCKLCTDSCHSLENFIEHKKEAHFEEFQKTKLIVFEEITNPNMCSLYPNLNEQTSTFDSACANIQQNKLNLHFEVVPLPDSKLLLNTSHADAKGDIEGPSGLKFSSHYVFDTINSNLNTTANVIKAKSFEEVPIKTEPVEDTEPEIRIEPKTELVTYENFNLQNLENDKDIEDMELIVELEDKEETSVSDIDLTHVKEESLEIAEDTDESFILSHHSSTSASKTFLPVVSSANISFDNLSYNSSSNEGQDGNTIIPCQLCPETFQRESHFISHMQIHNKTKEGDTEVRKSKFKCFLCNYETNRLKILTRHVQTHSEDLPYKCPKPHCGKSFKTKPYLDSHLTLDSHSGTKKFPCPHPNCGKSFRSLKYSKVHLTNIHLTKTGAFKCKELECEKAFKSSYYLKQHIRQCHHGEVKNIPS